MRLTMDAINCWNEFMPSDDAAVPEKTTPNLMRIHGFEFISDFMCILQKVPNLNLIRKLLEPFHFLSSQPQFNAEVIGTTFHCKSFRLHFNKEVCAIPHFATEVSNRISIKLLPEDPNNTSTFQSSYYQKTQTTLQIISFITNYKAILKA
jgi:hypothetical protein